MATRDPRIDAYIEKAPEYARPVLVELRARVHAACPEVKETLKWRTPSFEHHGLLGGMAAFKAYCTFGFWKETLLKKEPGLAAAIDAVGRMTTRADLPTKRAFAQVLAKAMALNEAGVAVPRRRSGTKPPLARNPDFLRALAANPKALRCFEAFPPGAQREYHEWIVDARKDDTRARRIEQAVVWIAEGKRRNWKYERC